MTRPHILVTRKLPDAVGAGLARDYDADLNPNDEVFRSADLIQLARDVDGVLTATTERWDAELIARLPERVRVIVTFSVGYEARRPRRLPPPRHRRHQHARRAHRGHGRRGDALPARRRAPGLGGRDDGARGTLGSLGVGRGGKVLGVVGMGRVGQAMARRARGFGLEVHYYNRSRLPPEREEGAKYHEALESMLPLCCCLSLHCPGGSGTERLLDWRAIGLLPDGAVVVNTARGSLVDDEALLAALRSGKLFAAGLDVFAGGPDLHPGYLGQANCLLLPHVGNATVEARDGMGFRCLDNLDAFFGSKGPPDALA